MKKIISLVLVCVLALTAIGGTLAYFTDTDKAENVFTIGSVDIQLIESQYHRVNAGKGYTTEKEPIKEGYLWASNVTLDGTDANTSDKDTGSTWTGTYFSDDQIKNDAKTYKDEGGYFDTHSKNMVPGSNVRKNPYVVNTGSNDAYVRVRALVPVSLFKVLDNGASYWTTVAMDEGKVVSKAVDAYNKGMNDFLEGKANEYIVTGKDGVQYYEFDFTYTYALKAGEMTFWNVWGNIAIDKNATADDLKDVESFNVIFEADAIQAEGFADYTAAWTAFDAQKQ